MRHIQVLLEKTGNYDKDERYMATSDLCTELQSDIKIDMTLEKKICAAVIKQLNDTSNDVQAVAVKCLSLLVKKVDVHQVNEICSTLCTRILSEKQDLRDIYSIGLKTALKDLPEALGPGVAQAIAPRLLTGVVADENEGVKIECLDILTDLIKLYGHAMVNDHSNICQATLKQLAFPSPAVKKRATACLGRLATVVNDDMLDLMMRQLLEQIEKPTLKGASDKRTIIQTIGTISKMVGLRLGGHLSRVMPLFLSALGQADDESMHTEGADDLRENIMNAFDSFFTRCPSEATNHVETVLTSMIRFVRYDPNYHYDDDADGADDDMDGDDIGEDYGEDLDDDQYSDEDDTSWKVRRASLKVIRAIVISRPEMLETLYTKVAPVLLDRFKERDENVKLDVIACLTELVSAIGAQTASLRESRSIGGSHLRSHVPQPFSTAPPTLPGSGAVSSTALARSTSGPASSRPDVPDSQRQEALIQTLRQDVDRMMRASLKVLSDKKAVKAKISVFRLSSALCTVLNGGLDKHVGALLPSMILSLRPGQDSSLMLETLLFTGKVVNLHSPKLLQPHMKNLCPVVIKCISQDWYKVVAEALRVVAQLTVVIQPRNVAVGGDVDMVDSEAASFDATPFVQPIYQAVLPRLHTHDVDVEIKEAAIACIGQIFARLGDRLQAELATVIQLLQQRLGNENTRLPALKCVQEIASSPLRLDLGKQRDDVITQITEQFLKQNSRTLKQQTLATLDALVKSPNSLSEDILTLLLTSSTRLIDSNDLYLSQMAIDLAISSLAHSDKAVVVPLMRDSVLPSCTLLMCSATAGGLAAAGHCLSSVLRLLENLVVVGSPELTFEQLLAMLIQPTKDAQQKLSKAAVESLAMGLATVCLACRDIQKRDDTVRRILIDVEDGCQGKTSNQSAMHLAITTLGEFGRAVDLGQSIPKARDAVLSCLQSPNCNEELRSAAASALGDITLGSMQAYLPELMAVLQQRSEQAQQYLLLSSLREVIVKHSSSKSKQTALAVQDIMPVLQRHCQSDEEGVRNMVAECLGKLAAVEPDRILPYLVTMAGSPEALVRWTVVTSIKYMSVTEAPAEALARHVTTFAALLSDPDLMVRRAAIVGFNSIAHHRPRVIRDSAQEVVIPVLFELMIVNPLFKRTVDLGPFKHTVDDGLPLRKASFTCLLTMLFTMPDVVPLGKFVPVLVKGLADVDDVAMLCHQTVAQLAALSPHVLLSEANSIIEPIAATLAKSPKEVVSQPSGTHADDVIRSALRALDSIACIPESSQNRKVLDVVAQALAKEHLVAFMEADHLETLLASRRK